MRVCTAHKALTTSVYYIAWCLVMMASCPNGYGQDRQYLFEHLTPDNGLSQSTVFATTRDKAGFVWMATREGLNRYDAHRIKVYKHRPDEAGSLLSNAVYALLTDRKGKLWVGSNIGLAAYQPENDTFEPIRGLLSRSGASTPTSNISCLLEDRAGKIWVGTRDGLNVLDATEPTRIRRLSHVEGNTNTLPHSEIRALFVDSEGTVWVGTSRGFARVVQQKHNQYRFVTYYPNVADSLYQNTGNWVNTIAEDKSGRLWLGTEKSGLLCFDKKQGKFHIWATHYAPELANESIRTIATNKNGILWVGTINGLNIIDPATNSVVLLKNNPAQAGSLSDNSIKSIYIDSLDSYWIGTFYGGVNTYSPLAKPFGHVRLKGADPLPFKIASALVMDKAKRLWIGTEDNGVFLTDANHRIIRHYYQDVQNPNSLSSNKVKCLLPEGDQGLWIGTLKGLNYLDFQKNTITHYLHKPGDPTSLPDDRLYDLKNDRYGQLWLASYWGGLCRFDRKSHTFERLIDQPQNKTSVNSSSTCLFEDSQKRFWVGSQFGLHCQLPQSTGFRQYMHQPADSSSLSGDYILCIFEDSRHRIWIGTRDNGLNQFMPDSQTFQRFTAANGLPGNTVFSIQEDERGLLWLSTDNGLSRFNPKTRTCTNYDRSDGLVCKEFLANSSLRDDQGNLYFGGYNGIVIFKPGSIQTNTTIPPLAFTELRLFNRPVPIDSSSLLPQNISLARRITFDHTQNVFSVEFAALNFINPGKNRYAYKLANFDDHWNYVDEPVATYMNLSAGQYTLLVKGANNSGVWNPDILSLSITILPPPWRSWWAYTLYIMALGALLYVWMRFKQSQLKLAHELQLEHLDKIRQQELNEAKLNFFADVAHDIRTPLTLIVSPVETLVEKYAGDTFIQRQLALVSTNTNRLLQLMNQLLDFHRQETGQVHVHLTEGDFVGFAEEITNSFRDYALSRQISLGFIASQRSVLLPFDREELAKVLTNLLANAVKFTPSGGQINVRVDQPEGGSEATLLTVEDNGIGISAAELPHIFTRFYQAEGSGRKQAGFGLGLALSKGIVERHGGTITVDSREVTPSQNGFTRFTISLPVAPHSDSVLPQQAVGNVAVTSFIDDVSVRDTSETDSSGSNERHVLLLVEDNEAIRQHIRSLFSDTHTVLEAANGLMGWDIACEQLPDLIVSDVAMPDMDGLTLTHRLKNDERTRHIPVILLTAKGALSHQVSGLSRGADDYIPKPFHPSVLRLKVHNLLVLRERIREKYRRIVTLAPAEQAIDDPDGVFLQRLMAILEPRLADPDFNVSTLTDEIGMSRPVLFRKVKMLTGLSVVELIRSVRMKKAQRLLSQKGMTVAEVAFSVGFNDPKYFSKQFRSEFGKSPSEYTDSLV
ncbi:two-component regulator propeller domain-containing protein [soil metagenome]